MKSKFILAPAVTILLSFLNPIFNSQTQPAKHVSEAIRILKSLG